MIKITHEQPSSVSSRRDFPGSLIPAPPATGGVSVIFALGVCALGPPSVSLRRELVRVQRRGPKWSVLRITGGDQSSQRATGQPALWHRPCDLCGFLNPR